jgi:DNA gyrase subunit A
MKETILTVTENGFGKRTRTEEYRVQGRGGKGILTIKTTQRNGLVVYAGQVTDPDQLMIITEQGKIIRLKVADISVIGRNTQGVKLIEIAEGEKVVAVAKVIEEQRIQKTGDSRQKQDVNQSLLEERSTARAESLAS